MATREEFEAQVRAETEEAKPMFMGVNGEVVEYTDEDYEWHIQTRTDGLYQEQQFGWITARQEAYGKIGDQLDEIFKSIEAGDFGEDAKSSAWYLRIAQVKADIPKPVEE